MKLHRNLAEAVAKAIHSIVCQKASATRIVETLLASNKKWGARDRNFVAENIYEIVRNYRLLAHYAQSTQPFHLLAARLHLMHIPLPSWEVFDGFQFHHQLPITERKILLSIPDELDEWGVKELGEAAWTSEMTAMHQPAKLCLRVNTLKTTFQAVEEHLHRQSIPFEVIENTIVLSHKKNMRNSSLYQNGWVEIQDVNSQKIAPLLRVQPHEFVVDACAGAGGKTLHLAALMKNLGKIVATDVSPIKLKELQQRATRAGAVNIYPSLMNPSLLHTLQGKADKLLLDVPCSASGVFRRKPDNKLKFTASGIHQLLDLQWHILSSYHSILKPGGLLLYATCSIFPSENQHQVQRFLQVFPHYQLEHQYHFSPARSGFDGFYAAVLRKE
jgi:16S rRNA (cytosine967-C5)-methyltransferase